MWQYFVCMHPGECSDIQRYIAAIERAQASNDDEMLRSITRMAERSIHLTLKLIIDQSMEG